MSTQMKITKHEEVSQKQESEEEIHCEDISEKTEDTGIIKQRI